MKKSYNVKASPRMFEQVARQIADYIQAEQLEPGSKLPTERQLSELLQVSRSSVREGIRVLELLRFLDSKQGEGTFVSDPPPFLIPDRVIGQKLEPQALRHYFEIALMCAETVLMLSIQHHVRYSNVLSGKTFWENLLFFITGLGESLENPYFFVLFSETFGLVLQSGELPETSAPFEMQEIIDAYHASDIHKLKKLINLLSEHISFL
ncbi:FadR/GntR family transcriptional regulator [Paenibacillus naphthalenovorans]|uniref:GntR family transcriptional regulator n=1 Tax=Paenibacillus naphthalenovorans TaxID=162209 RepID=A0A0U2UA31_9BACL|nr:GntR family transcriptional regulator [Paenibacillus naphthalenovorans]ALS23064.1 GntR family transcriptional regulator [Paenibacillus naphthalenovorans]